MSAADAHDLRQLLELLALDSSQPISLEALDEVAAVSPTEPLPEAYQATIESMRDIAYRAGDFRQSGVFDFQVGLHFLDRGRYGDAERAFSRARRQWNFAGDRNLDLLAAFAEAVTMNRAFQYDDAASSYVDIRRALEREERRPAGDRSTVEVEFQRSLQEQLQQAAAELSTTIRRAQVRQAERDEIPLPLVVEGPQAPAAPEMSVGRSTLSYRLGRLATAADWRARILPDIEAMERVNVTLAIQMARHAAPAVEIAAIAVGPPLRVTLEGVLPETVGLLRDLAADSTFQERCGRAEEELEALRARLALRERELEGAERRGGEATGRDAERARLEEDVRKTAREIRGQEVALEAAWLAQAITLLEPFGGGAAPTAERYAAAATLIGDLQHLMGLLNGNGVGVIEGVSD